MIHNKKIKILIVDDSPTIREYLKHIISTDSELVVSGTAKDGSEAIELVQTLHPDLITMDIQMPRMDGYEATRKIMEIHPVPIVIISSKIPEHVENTFQAIRAGAVAVLEKPKGPGHSESHLMAAKIVQTIKLMSEVRVVKRFPKRQENSHNKIQNNFVSGIEIVSQKNNGKADKKDFSRSQAGVWEREKSFLTSQIRIVAIGASTGGPPVIRTILSNLIKDFPVPILLVQHIASGFIQGMADWLEKETGFPIQIPAHGEQAMAGHIYFAPDGSHMGISEYGKIILSKSNPENSLRPSVSYLFRSVAKSYGNRAVGILLTGMGKDGALELKEMKEKGAVTIAQDRESSVVHGMPGEAIKIDAATYIFSPEKIAAFLNSMFK